ncbi:MAG: glycosyl hydrolase [Verrucomicrobiales bacterium]
MNGDPGSWTTADALLPEDLTTSVAQGLTEFESTFIDLSSSSSFGSKFQGIDSVEFRIYQWGASGTAYSNALRMDQVVVEGEGDGLAPVFDLAKFQGGAVDSANGSTPRQYGNDGFVTQENRWVSSGSGPHWYEVELAVPMEIGSAHLYSGATDTAPIVDFSLQYYDGAEWLDIAGTSVSGNVLPVRNLTFDESVTAQRFRLYTTDGTARIKELALYPPTVNGREVPFGADLDLNLAKLRQFNYSSVAGSNYPALAIDGYVNDGSAWASANSAGPHSFEVHFPQSEEVRGIHLYSGFEGEEGTEMEDFTVDYWSGSAWVTFPGGTVTGNSEEYLNLWFDSAISTTRVRVQTTDAKQAVIRELVVFAENGGDPYPLWTDARHEAPPEESFLEYEDSYYTIENRELGALLATSGSGSSVTEDEEPWFQVLLNIGTDSYRLRSKDSGMCFEVENASTAAGAAIVEGNYTGMPHQRWRLVEGGDGEHFQIVNVWSGMVLGLDGDAVVQKVAGTETSKQWAIHYQTHYPKKGQASHFHFNSMFKPSWAYNWKYGDEGEVEYGQYYPMQWGGIGSSTAEILRYQPGWYGRANGTIVLGFNEPNLEDQSNMEEETAAYQWPRLQRMRLPLAGPCDSNYKGSWRETFNGLADERGLRTEYEAVHWYSPNGAPSGSPSTLINNLEYVYNLYGRKIMLTEFSTRDFAGDKVTWSRNHNYNFLAEFMWRAESLPWLKSWSLFEWGYGGNVDTTDANGAGLTAMNSPKLALHYTNDKTDPGYEDLMECGLLLAGWDGVAEVLENKPYIIHNKGRFLRLIDDPSSETVTYADVSHTEQTEQFILQTATSGNTYITGLSTGRRLSCDGASVGFAPAGSAGESVEWELNEYQYGWFYIDHPATGKRLRITDSNVIDVAGDSTTGDNLRFRFVVPAVEFEFADEAEGTVLVGYDFNASSSYPTNPSMTSSSVTATAMSSPMDVSVATTVGDNSGLDATGVGFGRTDELGCLGIAVSHATTSSFEDAVAGEDYVAFTVAPGEGRTLSLSSLSFKATKKDVNSVDEYAVADAAGNLIGSPVMITDVVGLTGSYDRIVVDLTGTAFETITTATEFRIYAWGRGTTSTGGTLAAIDKVVLRGTAGPVLVGYDFDNGEVEASELLSPHVSATAFTSPMDFALPTTIGDISGVDAMGLTFGNPDTLGCVGIRVTDATTTSFADALAGDDYVTFTITPSEEVTLDLTAVAFKASISTEQSVDEYVVTDEYGNPIGSPVNVSTLGQMTTYQSVIVSLSDSQYQGLSEPVTFRIYAWGRETTSAGGTLAMIDKVTLHGEVTYNTPPEALDQTVETPKDTPTAITLTGSDVEGDPLSFAVTSGPANGMLSGTPPNLIYTPNSGYVGIDSFTFTATDGQTTSDPGTLTVRSGVATDVVTGYDFDDGTGTETRAATVVDVSVTASNFGVGIGLEDVVAADSAALTEALDAEGSLFGTTNGLSFGGGQAAFGFSDMNGADSLTTAITNDDYMTFTITPNAGREMDLTRFTFRARTNSTDNGANRWALFSSVSGFAEGSQIAVGEISETSVYENQIVDLPVHSFTGLTDAVTFRLYIYGGNEPWGAATYYDKFVVRGDVGLVGEEDPYADWIAAFGLSGEEALPDADPEEGGAGDGYSNLLEFALGMDPTVKDPRSREAIRGFVEDGQTYFEYTYYRRTDYVELGLSYQLLDSDSLQDFGSSIDAQDAVIVGPEVDGFEPIMNRYLVDEDANFIRLRVLQE